MNINLSQYKVIPNWVFQFLADHHEIADHGVVEGHDGYISEVREFFENFCRPICILDEVKSDSVEEHNQQSYLKDMVAIAAEFGSTIISLESEEAKAYFLEKKRHEAAKFTVAANPFSAWSVTNNTLVIAGQS